MKPRDLQRQTACRLQEAGIAQAHLEAEILLRYFLDLDRVALHLDERNLGAEDLAGFEHLVARRLSREPLSYIVGEKEFWSLSFKVSPAVLIPRPETELLIEEVLKRIAEPRSFAGTILDLGSGSGVIPVVLARELPLARLVGVDISAAALTLAAENSRRHGVAARVAWLLGDWFAPIRPGSRFDFILANPPYVAESSRAELEPELDFEPAQALYAGADGMTAIRGLVPASPAFLVKGGFLLLEIGSDQEAAVTEVISSVPELELLEILKDYAGLPRLVVAQKVRSVAS
jgi:release factor glutamine methyltransferase